MDEKMQLIQAIVNHPKNTFGAKGLELKSIKQLKNILKSLNK